MHAGASEIGGLEIQCGELPKTVGPQVAERCQQLGERLAPRGLELGEAIERCEGNVLTVCEEMVDARHPVGALALNQVPDDIERAPGVGAFGAEHPWLRQIPQQSVENFGSSGQYGNGGREIEFHRVCYRTIERRVCPKHLNENATSRCARYRWRRPPRL